MTSLATRTHVRQSAEAAFKPVEQDEPALDPKTMVRAWYSWGEYVRIKFEQIRLSKGLPLSADGGATNPILTAQLLCTTAGTRDADQFVESTIEVPQGSLTYVSRGHGTWANAVFPADPKQSFHMASFTEPTRLLLQFKGALLTGEFVLGHYQTNGHWWVPMYANTGSTKNHVASILVKVSSAAKADEVPEFHEGPLPAAAFMAVQQEQKEQYRPVPNINDLTPGTYLHLAKEQSVFEAEAGCNRKVKRIKTKHSDRVSAAAFSSETHSTNETLSQYYNWVCLYMQGDQNLVIYVNGVAQWASWTQNSGAERLYFQTDGNLVLRDSNMNPLWWTSTQHANGVNNKLVVDSNGYCYVHYNNQLLWIAYWP